MLRSKWALPAIFALFAPAAFADPCLLNPTDVVGNPVFGATVQTFMNYGVDPTATCIENGIWTDPSGFALGTYLQGSELMGGTADATNLSWDTSNLGSPGANAANRDFYWVQDSSPAMMFPDGKVGGPPSTGLIWDLGGEANQAVIFPFVDHTPAPQEALENTVWLSDDPNAPDSGWTQAFLVHVYGAGWSADPNIQDGFVPVYRLPDSKTFRYVSVTWGGPGSINQDGDNEIDAVGGLTESGGGVSNAPEPGTALLAAPLLLGFALLRRHRTRSV
jgi:hypothetical protein